MICSSSLALQPGLSGETNIQTDEIGKQAFALGARAFAWSTGGNLIAIPHPDRRRVNVLDSQSLRFLAVCEVADDVPVAASFVLNDHVLAIAGGNSGKVWLWDIASAAPIGNFPSHTGGWGPEGPARKIGAMASNHQGNLIAVAGMDYPEGTVPDDSYHGPVDWTIKLWEISSMEQ